uniref:RRM domain-containing protein n=1 Tax=Globodera rostochiensis TaxID=31243 RepID=A0A914HYH3_GLORO
MDRHPQPLFGQPPYFADSSNPQPLSQFRPEENHFFHKQNADPYAEMLFQSGNTRSFFGPHVVDSSASSANPANIDGGSDALPSLMSVRHNSIGVGGGAPTYGFFDAHSQARPTSGVSAPYGKFFHHPGGDDFASARSFNNLPQRGHYFANYSRGGNSRMASRDEGPTDLIAMMLKEERQEEEVQGLSFFSKRQPIIPSRIARGTDGMPIYSSSYWKAGERRQQFEFGGGLQQQQQPIPRMMRLNSEGEFIVDFRNKSRLKKLLRIPEDKELWLETKTGQAVDFNSDDWHTVALEGRTYFYNPVTFRIFFERVPASRCVVVQQTELQKLLDATTPSTLIVERISSQLTEHSMNTFFEQYGKVAFSTICRYEDMVKSGDSKPSDHCCLAFIRMESVAVQSKILAKRFHLIDGLEVEVRISPNRLFVARLPEKVSAQDLVAYFSEEICKIDPTAYCVDAYFPVPFTQFAFVTCGGQQIAAKLAVKADLIFKHQSITVSSLHFEEGGNIEKLFNDKIQMLADRNELARVRSLLNIGDEVKLTLQLLAKTRKFTNPMLLLNEINTEFLKCTEEKIRNYLFVQEHVLDICKIVALKEGAGGENASDSEETLNEEEEVEEGTMQNAIFEDDNIAQAVVADRSFKSELKFEETLNEEEEVEEGTMQNAIFEDDNIAQAVVADRSFKSELKL